MCAAEAAEAQDGAPVTPGRIHLARGGLQLELVGGAPPRCRLRAASRVSGHCPSVDVLFGSVTRAMGRQAIGVILTGMGCDGAQGLLAMRHAGADTFGQDEASCVVYRHAQGRLRGRRGRRAGATRPPGRAHPPSRKRPFQGEALMPAARTLTTLVVDDQLTIRALVRSGLEQLGFAEILEAEDGEQGLRTMLTRAPSPKLDGMSLLRAVRLHPPTKAVPFIMLTGRADKELVLTAKQNGVNHYLVKPFAVATLRERIEAVVGALT